MGKVHIYHPWGPDYVTDSDGFTEQLITSSTRWYKLCEESSGMSNRVWNIRNRFLGLLIALKFPLKPYEYSDVCLKCWKEETSYLDEYYPYS